MDINAHPLCELHDCLACTLQGRVGGKVPTLHLGVQRWTQGELLFADLAVETLSSEQEGA